MRRPRDNPFMAKLKVYRTPAGFHDAYVAATSQKAALAAWGSDANLFARGIAEVVTDPALSKEPLANPGKVIRVARTIADAANAPPSRKHKAAKPAKPTRQKVPAKQARPKPSRASLDKAEAALEAAEARHAEARAALKREEEALAARRRKLDKEQAEERAALDRARIEARDEYDAALEGWRQG